MAAGRKCHNTTNHYLTTSATTEKDKNLCNIVGPAGPGNLYRLPPTPFFGTDKRQKIKVALQISVENKLCQNALSQTRIVEGRSVQGMRPWHPFVTESKTVHSHKKECKEFGHSGELFSKQPALRKCLKKSSLHRHSTGSSSVFGIANRLRKGRTWVRIPPGIFSPLKCPDGHTQPPVQCVPGFSHRGKTAGARRWQLTFIYRRG
jgi:hypothetical protein